MNDEAPDDPCGMEYAAPSTEDVEIDWQALTPAQRKERTRNRAKRGTPTAPRTPKHADHQRAAKKRQRQARKAARR